MGYIVDLAVILDDISRTNAGSVSVDAAQSAINRQIEYDRRDRIHRDIHIFVNETFANFTVMQRDLVLEKIVNLITQYCVLPSTGGSGRS